MPDWIGSLLGLCALVALIGVAFRQGTRPSRKKGRDDWPEAGPPGGEETLLP